MERQAGKESHTAKARRWLKRGRDEASAPWQRQVFRKKSFQWAACLDNALRMGAGISLSQYHMLEERRPEDPFSWPWLGVVADQGSDGACPLAWLLRGAPCNVEPFWDK